MTKTLKSAALAVILICLLTAVGQAHGDRFIAVPGVFDPDDIGGVSADWRIGIGLRDLHGFWHFGLRLRKRSPITANTAAGATLLGLRNEIVMSGDVLGYDIRNTSPCLAGAPRFNVSYMLPGGAEGFSFVGGCANGTRTPAPQAPLSWTRVTLDLQNPAHSFPVVPLGAMIQSVTLLVDEPGTYIVDNIRFRDQFADRPGFSGREPD